jgi:hypothetical protein
LITIADLKWQLRFPAEDTKEDENLLRVIERVENYIRTYCNNENLVFEDNPGLDEVVLYLCIRALNPETSSRAGLASTSQGISSSFLTDLPEDLKRILLRFRKVSFT